VLVTKIGPKIPLVTGLVVGAAGLAILSQISAGGSYLGDLLPGMLVVGSGLGLAFVSMSIGALEGIEERDAGLASGLINTTQQVGGALGVAVLSTLALTRTDNLLADGAAQPSALTEGFQIGLIAAATFAAIGAVAALALIRGKPKPQPQETSDAVVTRARPQPAPSQAR
jgi:fucose permease